MLGWMTSLTPIHAIPISVLGPFLPLLYRYGNSTYRDNAIELAHYYGAVAAAIASFRPCRLHTVHVHMLDTKLGLLMFQSKSIYMRTRNLISAHEASALSLRAGCTTFPLIGPESKAETRSLDFDLKPSEPRVYWCVPISCSSSSRVS